MGASVRKRMSGCKCIQLRAALMFIIDTMNLVVQLLFYMVSLLGKPMHEMTPQLVS